MEVHMLNKTLQIVGIILATILIIALVAPRLNVNWGTVSLAPASTIIVSGQAQSLQKNQVASFNAGVMALNQDRQAAVDEVNTKMEELITAVKDFGIPQDNIQTESISVNREEVFDETTRTSEPGQSHANNSISIKLEEVSRASELADLLSASGATNVYGPNFTVEDTQGAQVDLMSQAIENAREKAQAMAQASGRSLGKVVSVSEGTAQTPQPFLALEGRGGGAPLEPGTTTVSQSVTITFELK
jgi:hypothetical protein